MNIIISGKQMDLTDGIKNAIEEKLGRLDFYLHPATDVKVTVSAKKARQKVEVTIIPISGPIIRAEDIEENLYAAIDVVYDKLNKQLRKYKKRLQDRHQSNESIRFDEIEDIEENDYSSNEDNLDIVIKILYVILFAQKKLSTIKFINSSYNYLYYIIPILLIHIHHFYVYIL